MEENEEAWKRRCVVVSPRHEFIRPWIRAYFATGNMTPLVIVPGPEGDWRGDDFEYCTKAAKFCGGLVFDCSKEWKDSERLASRAVRRKVGWYSKKSILYAVATRLAPESWCWIDDDAEVTGNIDECFDFSEKAPGFICTQFYFPSEIDSRHPDRTYRSNIDTGDKISWNSFMFFHGEANARMSEELHKDFPVEDDEIVFCNLYQHNPVWHNGFYDFSIRDWQKSCKLIRDIPHRWTGKILHYTSTKNQGEVKKMWAAKSSVIPKAPFEEVRHEKTGIGGEGPVDAVFVIGEGSIDGNTELRYALRNLEKHCGFIRNVYICGFCPSWVDKTKVKHLQWPDRFSHAKDANIIDKLRHACETPGIAKRILFCSDDQFQTHPCSWEDFRPRYLRRYTSKDGWYAARKRIWHDRLRDTLERDVMRRKAAGLNQNDVFYYQPHIWMPIDRDRFIEYARWCNYERRHDTIIASGYFNFIDADGVPDFDHVFIGGGADGDVPEATHVAYHDGSYKIALKIMQKLFPGRSRFEIEEKPVNARHDPKNPSSNVHSKKPEKYGRDPSPASKEELSEIMDVTDRIRGNPMWSSLLGEISRAEELRLFGVFGWRIVWNDIILRWRKATDDGIKIVPVEQKRSPESAAVISAYQNDPESMRTIRFGSHVPSIAPTVVQPRRFSETASDFARGSIRERVRSSLHMRMQK